MKHGSLFSGIGGFDLAAEWMGWENVFHCEWNDFGKRVLSYYWPNAISYNDITKTDFTIHRGGIDILTGGFPCQPYSAAGKRRGKDDERHLWPEMLRAIREIQPRWVVGENVFGITNWNGGLVFDEVQADLEAEGYEVQAYVLPACAVNAPHRRDRVWFVAYSNSCRNNSAKGGKESVWQYEDKEQQRSGGTMQINGLSNEQVTTHADGNGRHRGNSEHEKHPSQRGFDAQRNFEPGNGSGTTPHAARQPSQRMRPEQRELSNAQQGQLGGNGSEVGNGDATHTHEPGWTEQHGAGEPGTTGHAAGHGGGWENFPTTQPTICAGDDGVSSRLDGITFSKWRNESIKAAGNAVVPQVVYQIFQAIQQYEHEKENAKRTH